MTLVINFSLRKKKEKKSAIRKTNFERKYSRDKIYAISTEHLRE